VALLRRRLLGALLALALLTKRSSAPAPNPTAPDVFFCGLLYADWCSVGLDGAGPDRHSSYAIYCHVFTAARGFALEKPDWMFSAASGLVLLGRWSNRETSCIAQPLSALPGCNHLAASATKE